MQIEKSYPSIEIPTLLVVGTKDKVGDAYNSVMHLKHRIKDLSVVKMDKVGHGLAAENEAPHYRSVIKCIEEQ